MGCHVDVVITNAVDRDFVENIMREGSCCKRKFKGIFENIYIIIKDRTKEYR